MSKLKEGYLVSGKDIKTINGKPITGEGDLKINEVPEGGVSPAMIANNAVDTGKIANNAVTTNKIANKAVTEAKIADSVTERLLPTVTSSDAGKVASVDSNGDWVAAEAGGGSNDFVVTYEGSGTITSDKTFAEISAAITAGKNVRGIFKENPYITFVCTIQDFNSSQIHFGFFGPTGSNIKISVLTHSSSDTISTISKTIS